MNVNDRVRLWFGGTPFYGTVTHVNEHWARVAWEEKVFGLLEWQPLEYLQPHDAQLPPEDNPDVVFPF